jgi:CelD/BcsL family acetyltransferase involved in cellulose biosynthesis
MTPRLSSRVAVGDEAVALLHELADYVDARSEAFSTSSAWLLAAAEHLAVEPVVVTVRDGGTPVALAALGVAQRRGARRIELLGGELNDYGQLFHDDETAGAVLADAVATWVRAQHRWSLSFDQLAADDPVALALVARLGGGFVPGPPMPRITGVGTDYLLSRNRRRSVKKAVNRLERDGCEWELVSVDDRDGLARWLAPVIEARRERDHASGRRSHMDDLHGRAFYEAFLHERFAQGRGALHVLVIDGEVAGYNIVMRDGAVHRLIDGRVADSLQRYQGGMLCDVRAVAEATDDPAVTTFDWLRGETDSKFGNDEIRRVGLQAASHRWVTAVGEWEGAARRRIKAVLPETAVRKLVAR